MSEEKKPHYHGEVEALDELAKLMEKAYRKRMIQLRLDMKKILEKNVGRD